MSFFYFITSSLISFFTAFLCVKLVPYIDSLTSVLIVIIISAFSVLIVYLIQVFKYNRIMKNWASKYNHTDFMNTCENAISKSRNSILVSKIAVNLSTFYMQIGENEKAMNTLRKAFCNRSLKLFNRNIFLPKKFKMLYYNNIINLYLYEDKVTLADAAYKNGVNYLSYYTEHSSYSVGIYHTLSSLELKKGNLSRALEYIDKAVALDPNNEQKLELAFLKAQIFLMTGKLEDGVKLLNIISENEPSRHLSEQIDKYWLKITTP